ncbi:MULTISPECIES: RNA-binding S4 domain-containing protein [Pelosinus]|uniref:S4-like RNA binding protein n=1 Tax=Pelosinus fermentans B4 TaxID=1149862 RepID=I9AXG9_9FIRM|nr:MULTISPECIES: RNA-binding S4 domain-containing protein [Pelosinus]EIW17592.1 S4-like RNA binding protein [Pelosinus fermentans B4]EIW23329.1 RNA-binding S4 domain protein [Pelosinus fermentans A11]OAM92147.1 S4 domain protein [Pelosinus fermentans DSM 17108]SDQ34842.1 ribosome-associated protein [Pelosinus fermentans]
MEEIGINTATIQLDQFLKWAGIIESGGQVKLLIEDGLVFINGAQIHERRKKILPGDIIEITDIGKWKVTTE